MYQNFLQTWMHVHLSYYIFYRARRSRYVLAEKTSVLSFFSTTPLPLIPLSYSSNLAFLLPIERDLGTPLPEDPSDGSDILPPSPLPLNPLHLPLHITLRPHPSPARLSILPQARREPIRDVIIARSTALAPFVSMTRRAGGRCDFGFRSPRWFATFAMFVCLVDVLTRAFRGQTGSLRRGRMNARMQRFAQDVPVRLVRFIATIALAGVALAFRGVVVLDDGCAGAGEGGNAGLALVVSGFAAVFVAVCCGAFGGLEGARPGGRLGWRRHCRGFAAAFDAEAVC